MARIHYSIVQKSFLALKLLCALLIHPSLPKPWQPLIFLLSPRFFLLQNVFGIIQYVAGNFWTENSVELSFWPGLTVSLSALSPVLRRDTLTHSSQCFDVGGNAVLTIGPEIPKNA